MKFRVVYTDNVRTVDSSGTDLRTNVSMVCDHIDGVPNGATLTLSMKGEHEVAVGSIFHLQSPTA
jgi:hypothetical protein